MCTVHTRWYKIQVGVTRFNMDGSGSNYSVSTSNSPMMNRDVQQPFNQGEYGSDGFNIIYCCLLPLVTETLLIISTIHAKVNANFQLNIKCVRCACVC